MTNPISDSAKDLSDRIVAADAGLDTNHVFIVYDEKALGEKINVGILTPFAGIVYGGLEGLPGADVTRQGLAANLQFAVLFGLAAPTIANVDSQDDAWNLMTAIRKAIRTTVSPTGHKWRWVRETYLGRKNDAVYYAQHWAAVAVNI